MLTDLLLLLNIAFLAFLAFQLDSIEGRLIALQKLIR